mgnify:CR=1 FL=1
MAGDANEREDYLYAVALHFEARDMRERAGDAFLFGFDSQAK